MKKLTPQDRAALLDWDEFRKSVREHTGINADESQTDKMKRIARLEANHEEWFAYYFPTYYKSEPAAFHRKATKRLMENNRWYEVRAWSRELAKSARAMMEITKLALTGKIRNVLMVSASYDGAERLLMPLMVSLEANQRIINDYGIQQSPGQWEAGEFTTQSGCAFRALGAGQSPRGTRNESFRPDFICVDDIDTDEETRNPDRIKKKWDWIEQALIPTVSVSGNYRILFNGNIIAKDCCITRAIAKANHVDVINIRGKDGLSSWPAKNSEEDIDSILSKISTLSAQKEYFNNPLSEGDTFKELHWGKIPPLSKFRFLVAYGDPAPSNSTNGKGSFKSVFLVGQLNGINYVIDGYLDHVVNAEFVKWYYNLNAVETRHATSQHVQIYNFIENNKLQDPFYQQVFVPLFSARAESDGFLGITPDTRAKPDKFSRIEGNLQPLNDAGRLILNEAMKENPHFKRLEEQFLLINPQMKSPADGPDCIEGAIWKINEKFRLLTPDSIVVGQHSRNRKRI